MHDCPAGVSMQVVGQTAFGEAAGMSLQPAQEAQQSGQNNGSNST